MTNNDDGVFTVRVGGHSEKLIQLPFTCAGAYRRYTEENGNRIVFVKQGDLCAVRK